MSLLDMMLAQPFPEGWVPRVGETVVVPALDGSGRGGWRVDVTAVLGDMVRVRRWWSGKQTEFLIKDVRPCRLLETKGRCRSDGMAR